MTQEKGMKTQRGGVTMKSDKRVAKWSLSILGGIVLQAEEITKILLDGSKPRIF